MATKKETPTGTVKARVLSDCVYGKWGEVVEVDAELAKTCQHLDTDPAAVAYAESQAQA